MKAVAEDMGEEEYVLGADTYDFADAVDRKVELCEYYPEKLNMEVMSSTTPYVRLGVQVERTYGSKTLSLVRVGGSSSDGRQ